jgi:outer membrane protein OmpA-like peptidoglycan-associated protein/tetratricopeptide (TPR) repeat protein
MNKYTTLYVLLSCLLMVGKVFGQDQPSLRYKADLLFSKYEFAEAAKLYQALVKKPDYELGDLEHLVGCYWKMNDYDAMEQWYKKVVDDPRSTPEHLLTYGKILKGNARYEDAKKVFNDYIAKSGSNEQAMREIAGCDSALSWKAKPTSHKIVNEEGVNTAFAEFSAVRFLDTVYYIGEPSTEAVKKKKYNGWTGHTFLHIFSSTLDEGLHLVNPKLADAEYHHERYHVGPVIGNKDGSTLYLTRTYPGKAAQVTRENRRNYHTNNVQLYIYKKNAKGRWEGVPFKYDNVKEYSIGHAALSTDQKTLYYVSNMPGGFGGTDIWYSELYDDGTWGRPVNAGPNINTSENEMFPTISPDGTLYFSSSGWIGMGGLDVFSSTGERSNWSAPQSLKYPVNSERDDFAYTIDGYSNQEQTGFLSSNRMGGKGDDDIYTFNYKPKLILALRGVVYNKKTQALIPAASVSLQDASGAILGERNSNEDGTFFFEVDKETDYLVVGEKEGFQGDRASVTTKGIVKSDTLEVVLYLNPKLEKGKTYRLENIHYDFDKDNIRPDAALILDELVNTMNEYPTLKIELSSHTDSRGSDAYNLDLSQRRAQSAVDYLISKGIARDRMEAKGYGETRLLNHCANGVDCSVPEHQANRRTDFTVLEN